MIHCFELRFYELVGFSLIFSIFFQRQGFHSHPFNIYSVVVYYKFHMESYNISNTKHLQIDKCYKILLTMECKIYIVLQCQCHSAHKKYYGKSILYIILEYFTLFDTFNSKRHLAAWHSKTVKQQLELWVLFFLLFQKVKILCNVLYF